MPGRGGGTSRPRGGARENTPRDRQRPGPLRPHPRRALGRAHAGPRPAAARAARAGGATVTASAQLALAPADPARCPRCGREWPGILHGAWADLGAFMELLPDERDAFS